MCSKRGNKPQKWRIRTIRCLNVEKSAGELISSPRPYLIIILTPEHSVDLHTPYSHINSTNQFCTSYNLLRASEPYASTCQAGDSHAQFGAMSASTDEEFCQRQVIWGAFITFRVLGVIGS
jgi:hypothetical protein